MTTAVIVLVVVSVGVRGWVGALGRGGLVLLLLGLSDGGLCDDVVLGALHDDVLLLVVLVGFHVDYQ